MPAGRADALLLEPVPEPEVPELVPEPVPEPIREAITTEIRVGEPASAVARARSHAQLPAA